MIWPVLRLNDRWPRAVRMLAISPEWLVMDRMVLESSVKISSITILDRATWELEDPPVMPFHSGSVSAKLGSNFHVGNVL